jgi:D-alanine-D-alanine ligase
MLSSHKIRVGVLRGGPSPEYSVSLETGRSVLDNLDRDIYEPVDIFISRDGVWHESGFEKSPGKILGKSDVVWNALHGHYGEDGEVQRLLESFRIPYTGSNALSSALGINKIMSKKVYRDAGLKTPFSLDIYIGDLTRDKIRQIYHEVPMPFVVKPSSAGSSVGVRVAYSLAELEEAIVAAFEYSPQVLVEEFINGKEATCGVIDNFRNTSRYALIPHSELPLSQAEKVAVERLALNAHDSLGLRHYSSSDFVIHPKRGIFILETDSQPSLHKESRFKKSLENVGSSISQFLHHTLSII